MNSLTLKRRKPFQNESKRKDTYIFAPARLIFKLQKEF